MYMYVLAYLIRWRIVHVLSMLNNNFKLSLKAMGNNTAVYQVIYLVIILFVLPNVGYLRGKYWH